MKNAQDHLVPVLSDSVYAGVKRAMVEVQRGTDSGYVLPGDMKQKLIPQEYQDYMPIHVIPVPQYVPTGDHAADMAPQGLGGSDNSPKKIDLNINVNGFEDVSGRVAEAGAELIAKSIPELGPSNINMYY